MDGSNQATGGVIDDNNIYVIINTYWEDLCFSIPDLKNNKKWYMSINTFETPGFYTSGKEPKVEGKSLIVRNRSIVVLIDKFDH